MYLPQLLSGPARGFPMAKRRSPLRVGNLTATGLPDHCSGQDGVPNFTPSWQAGREKARCLATHPASQRAKLEPSAAPGGGGRETSWKDTGVAVISGGRVDRVGARHWVASWEAAMQLRAPR